MSQDSKEFSLRRARALTLLALTVVGTGIALANLSSAGATVDFLERTQVVIERAERPFGWPLAWYWRMNRIAPRAIEWPISRLSTPRQICDVAIWLAILVGTAAACQWLLRRDWPRLRGRPRLSTLIPLIVVAIPTVLANLSYDAQPGSWQAEYHGWPLIWYCHIPGWAYFPPIPPDRWEYSALGLVGNLLAWFLILAVTGLSWEWFVRRYRPRLRWSLKTMLAAVGLAAVVCAWFAGASSRANKQDALIALLGGERTFAIYQPHSYYVERWGPKWLDLVGADRFRRSPCLKSLDLSWTTVSAEGLAKLAPLDSLEELAINEDVATSAGFESLIGLKRLKAVHVCPSEWHTGESEADNQTDLADDTTMLTLDDGSELVVFSGELDGLRRALAALRQSHRGIVIDAAYEEFEVKYEVPDLRAFVRQ